LRCGEPRGIIPFQAIARIAFYMGVSPELPIDPLVVANELISFIRNLPDDGRVIRTAGVKTVLEKLANRKDYFVYPSGDGSAWMLDLIWFLKASTAIHLAVESEWGNEEQVLFDFQKLLCVKSPLKIMVYFAKRSFVHKFEAYLQEFDQHLEGENYLLIEFAPDPPDHAYLYRVTNVKNGRLRAVKFSLLELPLDLATQN
jgi:hypothetical protein